MTVMFKIVVVIGDVAECGMQQCDSQEFVGVQK